MRHWYWTGILALILSVMSFAYELLILSVQDRDARDMLWDFHITTVATSAQHLLFRAAIWPAAISQHGSGYSVYSSGASADIPVIVFSVAAAPTGLTCTPVASAAAVAAGGTGVTPPCIECIQLPCLAVSHLARNATLPPVNVGTDLGTWAVAANLTLSRTAAGAPPSSPSPTQSP